MQRLFSYTIPFDDGAAPNPFHNMCTLAICKPTIRRVARAGDWVAGLGSRHAPSGDLSGRLVYAMLVQDVISLEEYDRRAAAEWPHRVPDFTTGDVRDRLGDCIYEYSAGKPPYQRAGVHGSENRKGDLSGVNALIAREYYYFGSNAVPLPPDLLPILHQGQGHKSKANEPYVTDFQYWVRGLEPGLQGEPDLIIDWGPVYRGNGCAARAQEHADDPVC